MGRPPKSGDKPMVARLEIRVDPAEKAAYVAAAQAAGLDCSDWIRATLNAAAKRKSRKRAGKGGGDGGPRTLTALPPAE